MSTHFLRPLRAGALALCLTFALSLAGTPSRADDPRVAINVANRGVIVVELYAREAPKTTEHFLDLAKKKFYDGILFHRVINGFVAQAGDPKSRGLDGSKLRDMSDQDVAEKYHLGDGGSGKNIPFEANSHVHDRGTVAMALSAPRSDTGDSQFFLNLVANHRLDGDYCVFGKVVKGLDVMDKIQQGDKIVSIRPVVIGSKKEK